MRVINTKEPIILLIGDILVLCMSLWVTLLVRFQQLPSLELWNIHVIPFSIIFALWIIVFYLAGLYEKHTAILKNKLPSILFNAHIISSVFAAIFFYVIPFFSITPKTILVIFIVASFLFLYMFRIFVFSKIFTVKKENSILIGEGDEVVQLYTEVNMNKNYALHFVSLISPQSFSESDFELKLNHMIEEFDVSVIVLDLKNKNIEPFLPKLYALLLENIKFIDLYQVYEDVFDKVPVSLIQYSWFIEHISVAQKVIYDILKRTVDIVVALIGGSISLLVYPFVIIGIKIESPGPVFLHQTRVGKNNKPIVMYKFRSMYKDENGSWIGESKNKITKFGKFLRKSSIDEFPQFWNILKGDISLIGPRPDMTGLEARLSQEIPYYSVRYVVKPGLSGWAQTKQDVIPNTIEENKERLAYDLYYIKNRSLFLDIKIILKTIKTLLTRGGR
jgi:exopolysaccharide biosynthesis polyprenyl glycosylphosphotransferase